MVAVKDDVFCFRMEIIHQSKNISHNETNFQSNSAGTMIAHNMESNSAVHVPYNETAPKIRFSITPHFYI
jgi:hypothetical protein